MELYLSHFYLGPDPDHELRFLWGFIKRVLQNCLSLHLHQVSRFAFNYVYALEIRHWLGVRLTIVSVTLWQGCFGCRTSYLQGHIVVLSGNQESAVEAFICSFMETKEYPRALSVFSSCFTRSFKS